MSKPPKNIPHPGGNMSSEEIFVSALAFEKKNRDLYLSAVKTIDDKRGKSIFKALADDEQSHVDFLEYSLEMLKSKGQIDIAKLDSSIPQPSDLENKIEKMKAKIPRQFLGNVQRVLNTALQFEIETTEFYQDACDKTQGSIKEIFKKFVEIERRHEEIVQIELDHASNSGHWFDFMEADMEEG